MRLGIAKRLTLPDRNSMLRGYGFRKELSHGIEDPVELGVMALSEGEGKETVLIITADMAGINVRECGFIYELISKKFGIPAERVWISSSHTHFAPGFESFFINHKDGELAYGEHPEDSVYRSLWQSRLTDAAEAALNSMEECVLEHVQVDVPGIMFNRRTIKKSDGLIQQSYTYPDNADELIFQEYDSTVSAWRFVTAHGPKAMLMSVGCHPVTGGKDAYCVSGDYPWFFKQKAEELFGCPAFFMLGAAGDTVPRLRGEGTQKKADKVSSRRMIGDILAMTLRQNDLLFRKDDKQSVAMKVVELPVRRVEPGDCGISEADPLELMLLEKRFPEKEFNMPLRFLRLGDKVLCGMPFEVLSAISLELKKANPEAVLISVTGGYDGYLPLQKEFARKGYECSFGATHVAAGTGDAALKCAIEESRTI